MKQTLTSFSITPVNGTSAAVAARLAADVQFQSSTLELHLVGDSKHNYTEYALTPSGDVMLFPSSLIDTTTDSSDPNATYTMYLVDARGKEAGTVFERWAFNPAHGTSVLYRSLEEYNTRKVPLRDDETYSKLQILNLLSDLMQGSIHETFTGNGVATTVTLSQTPVLDSELVIAGNVPWTKRLTGDNSYQINGRVITFGVAPQNLDQIDIYYRINNGLVAGGIIPNQIQEGGGPSVLTLGNIADGKFLKRVGSAIVGADAFPILNVVAYGADPTGVSSSTAAIQAAINAAAAVGGEVYFPVGNFKVTSTITISNGYGLIIRGAINGEYSGTTKGTRLTWAGNNSSPMIVMNGCIRTILEKIGIKSSSAAPLLVAIRSQNSVSQISTRNVYRDIYIDGTDSTGLGKGFEFAPGAGNYNNDESEFIACSVFNYSDAAWDITHGQSAGHKFYDIQFQANEIAGTTGIRLMAGNYIDIWGVSGGGNTVADFSTNGASMHLDGGHFEHSTRLISNTASFSGIVTLKSVTWFDQALHADKKAINWLAAGVLSLEQVSIMGGVYDSQLYVSPTSPYTNQFGFSLRDCVITTATGANPFTGVKPTLIESTLIINVATTEPHASNWHNNTFRNVAYSSTTPTILTANADDWVPAGYNNSYLNYVIRASSDASRNITGLNPSGTARLPNDGEAYLLINIGVNNIVIKYDTTSTAGYRIITSTGADLTLAAKQACDLIYDSTQSRWLAFKRN